MCKSSRFVWLFAVLLGVAGANSIPSPALAAAAFAGSVDTLQGNFSWSGTISVNTNISDPSGPASGTSNISFNNGSASLTAVSGIESWSSGMIEISDFVLDANGTSTSSDSGTLGISGYPVDWDAYTRIQRIKLTQVSAVEILEVFPVAAPDYGANSPGLGPWQGVLQIPVDILIEGESKAVVYGVDSGWIDWDPITVQGQTIAFEFELQRDTPASQSVLTAVIESGESLSFTLSNFDPFTKTFPGCEVFVHTRSTLPARSAGSRSIASSSSWSRR